MINDRLNSLLRISFESIFAIAVINNLVIFVWRIIWSVQDAYFNENKYLNAWMSLLGAYLIIIYARCKQIRFQAKLFQSEKQRRINDAASTTTVKASSSIADGQRVESDVQSTSTTSTLLTLDEDRDDHHSGCLLDKKMKLKNIVDNALTQTNTNVNVKKNKSILSKKIVNWKETIKLKTFILVFSFANINHWRGVWYLTSMLTNDSTIGLLSIGVLSILPLLIMKRFCALMSVPFAINNDGIAVAYRIQPDSKKHDYYLKTTLKIEPSKWQMALSVMYEFLADVFTIQSWRSLWTLLDQFLLVNEPIKSAQVSLLFGAVIYITMFAMNRPIRKLMKHKCPSCCSNNDKNLSTSSGSSSVVQAMNSDGKSLYLKLAESDSTSSAATSTSSSSRRRHFWCWDQMKNSVFLYTLILVAFVGTVALWRGIWMLQIEYCYPTVIADGATTHKQMNENLINLAAMIVSVAVLIYFNATSTLLPRSCVEDNIFYNGENTLLTDLRYRKFFIKKQTKKSAKTSQTIWKRLGAKLLCMDYFSEPPDCRKLVKTLVTVRAPLPTPTALSSPVAALATTAISARQSQS